MRRVWTVLGIVLFPLTAMIFRWVWIHPFPLAVSLGIIMGGILLTVPIVWIGRKLLDRRPTVDRAIRINVAVHYTLMVLMGSSIVEAIQTHASWYGWALPIPTRIGSVLVAITGLATLLTVVNLALRGLGAPFALALSRKLAVDWMYAWTRNPMVLGVLSFLFSLGIAFQSALFLVWVLVLVTPVWILFVKLYEERELEIRFGEPYLAYRARTPLLFPKRPGRET